MAAQRSADATRAVRRAAYLQRRALLALPLHQRIALVLRGAGSQHPPAARTTP
ncbi:MAG: hypothetical protein NVV66_13810 [Cellulomonas sp.]|uniref:hypothetical protein n=1 Tax=Cellulomonas sp. TaxID=40001 RepID=UPI00258A9404|nr:hypothetical protein [Cellulomonas sp.]MCR6705710.1 hypothetical protein [Cellulomonas sp.]